MIFFKRYFRSYKLLLSLSLVLSLMVVEYIAMTSAIDKVETAIRKLNTEVKRLNINTTKANMDKLDNVVEQMHIPQYTAGDARAWLLEVTEDFKRLYDTKIVTPITSGKSSYSTVIRFEYLPDNPSDLLKLIEYMENSISPIYNVRRMDFKEMRGSRRVMAEVEIIQPFKWGEYDY